MSIASPLERLMLDLVNQERRDVGLDPLRLETRLNDASDGHSTWMIDRDRFDHTGAGGSSAGDRMRDAGFSFEGRWTWGENIALQSERGASGLGDDVADLHEGLMNSPGHRANILNPNFEVMGIGVVRGDYRGYDAVVVTQNFARTDAALRIDGGGRDPVTPPPAPGPAGRDGTAPTIAVQDFEREPGAFTRLQKFATYDDADGDAPLRYEIDSPEGARVVVDRRTVDASDGHVLDADDFATMVVRFDASGRDQTFRLRVEDEDGWSDWDSFTIRSPGGADPAPKPAPKPAPAKDGLSIVADEIVIAVGERIRLEDHIAVRTGDDPVRSFNIVDPDGGANLWIQHRGEIDASDGLWIGARPMGRLFVEADDRPSVTEMRILVTDGEDRTGYETVTVTTEWEVG